MRLRGPRWAAVLWLSATTAGTGCGLPASAPIAPAPAAQTRIDIQSLVERGCYQCLERAFREAVEEAPAGALGSAQASEAAILLAARSKELGLPYESWLARAQAVLPPGPDWTDYIAIVRSLRIDPLSDDRDRILEETLADRATRETVAGWRADLAASAGSAAFRAYLELSLVCQNMVEDRASAIKAADERFHDVPLVSYRVGLCGPSQAARLLAVRETDPEFADADLALGRYALDIPRQPDQEEALRRLTAARAAFPQSPAIVGSLGSLHEDREEWTDALEAYEATLALVPTHRDALLGRTVTLSRMNRFEDAIAAATHILDLGSWFTGEAYYWRAWNFYHLSRIEEARADTDRAKGLMHSAPVLVLSGMIEWHEHRLDTSETELQTALTIDAGQCEAAFLLGVVRGEQRQWAPGAAAFELAQRCYDLSVTLRRETIARITAGPGSEEGKSRQIARQQRVMNEEVQHRDDAADNAARLQRRAGV
jgi:tetratricopeptide (TPR) repeat protein